MTNNICNNCANLGINCNGTECQTWTGCVYRKINLREGDTVVVHLHDSNGAEIITRNHGKAFVVYNKGGKFGIKWNACNDDEITPFSAFASSVKFERISDGSRFFYSNIHGKIVIEELTKEAQK